MSRQQLILQVAKREFVTKGYDGARTTSIAKAAGVTHAMLHYYFRTKEHLFECVIDDEMQEIVKMVISILGNPNLPLLERLRASIAAHFDFIAADPALPRFVLNEVLPHPERCKVISRKVREIAGGLFVELQKKLDDAAERGEVERVNAVMIIFDIISLNVFTFIAAPIVDTLFGTMKIAGGQEQFLKMRRAENIDTIMRRVKKLE